MAGIVALIINEDKILLKNQIGTTILRLPIINVAKDEDEKSSLNEYLISNISNDEEELLKIDPNLDMLMNGFSMYLVDYSNKSSSLKKELPEGLVWEDISILDKLCERDVLIIKVIVENCIKVKYSSIGISRIENRIKDSEIGNKYLRKINLSIADKRIDEETPMNLKLRALMLSVLVGIIYFIFSFHKGYKTSSYLGISYFIFASMVLIYFIAINGIRNKNGLFGYFLIGSSMLVALTFAIYTNPLIRSLNRIFVPSTLIMGFVILNYKDVDFNLGNFINGFFKRIFTHSFKGIIKVPDVTFKLLKGKAIKKDKEVYKSILQGILISIPVILLLGSLLSGADNVFGYYIKNLNEAVTLFRIGDSFWQLISSIFVAVYIFGLIWSFRYKFRDESDQYFEKKTMEPIKIITLLIIINMLYLVFTKVQISYLYAGDVKLLPGGLSYSEYARKGFFELVIVTIINMVLISFFKAKVIEESEKLSITLNILYTLIVGFTLNMMFSAFYKMNMYVEAFGYTRLRILVQLFIILLGIVIILQLIYIWMKISMFKPILVVAVVFYLFINFFNIDAFIARKNIEVYKDKGMNESYLKMLSFDALKEMDKALEDGKIDQITYNNWIKVNKDNLHTNNDKWYEYNYYIKESNKSQ
ncbi:DUF4153 domain-containing protein [Clostridium algidicarnis]|uniref:DUF4153 domain-containing protein n=1 Tax=Clostridium algidicarnis TaxID=37659 RepID=UPI001C0AD560|nr:DUF4173 domain-containing protein [Clostridium algidicarnis]MBU3210658.1 DUF4173 domain-containing protein [Clostridium algidicarnis]MBU3228792.1 DUF4173 domain-containing protein [Clostridium algidicarnis]MBU3252336.1 DUF4173 domain-containing protein [Clostridium algidicarnis]